MKTIKKDIWYIVLIILPFVVTACFMPLLPEQVPSELLNLEAEWVSKYKYFVKNAMTGIIVVIYYFAAIWNTRRKLRSCKEERERAVLKNAEKNNNILLIAIVIMMNIISFSSLWMTYQVVNGNEINIERASFTIVNFCIGVCWIVLGNVLPRMYEYKDPFSRKWKNASPHTLRKVNSFTGISFTLCGAAILFSAFIGKGQAP